MTTVQRFEQQTDEITIIAPFYTVIINQNSDRFNFFFEEVISVSSFIQNYCLIYNDIYQIVNSMAHPLGHGQ